MVAAVGKGNRDRHPYSGARWDTPNLPSNSIAGS